MAGEWLRYSNQGATRSQPLNPRLIQALSFLQDMGVTMDVFSGGQPSSGPHRVGSHRHDLGNAGDVMFMRDGRMLDWANRADRPIFEQIVQRAAANGVTGIGAGEGYMRPGSMHVGFGPKAVWGDNGSGANAPEWLRQAFGQSGNVPPGAEKMTGQMPTSGAQAMMTGGTTAAPNAFGDVVGPALVPSTTPPGGHAGVAFDMLRNSQERKRVEAEEQAREQERRVALFSPPPGAAPLAVSPAPLAVPPPPNVWSLYG